MKIAVLVLALLSPLAACGHALEVVNLHSYETLDTVGPPKRVAILTTDLGGDLAAYYRHAAEAIVAHPSVSAARTNWVTGDTDPTFTPDLVVSITPTACYSGSGWNYLVTFPGFVIFAHAWNGFYYYADISTTVDIYSKAGGDVLRSLSIPTPFDIRHCDKGRGFWVISGWWMPGMGATSLLDGFYNISYDTDVSSELPGVAGPVYGRYVAEKVMADALANGGL